MQGGCAGETHKCCVNWTVAGGGGATAVSRGGTDGHGECAVNRCATENTGVALHPLKRTGEFERGTVGSGWVRFLLSKVTLATWRSIDWREAE